MKLKLVVASMSVLAIVACPAFAADNAADNAAYNANATDTTTTTPVKHKHHKHHRKYTKHHHHHHHHHHHYVRHVVVAENQAAPISYKGEVPAQPVEVCRLSYAVPSLIESTQNVGRSIPNPCNPGWYHRIRLSGGANFDIGKWGDRGADYQGENYQRFSLNDVYLNVAANVNDWTKAFVSISFSDTSGDGGSDSDHFGYSSVYANHRLDLEQAFVTLGNFDVSPFYVQLGRQFQDFSRYEIHPITRSMTQVLSEVLATSAKLGFVTSCGFTGSIYAFDDPIARFNENEVNEFNEFNEFPTHKKTNYGAALGYDDNNPELGWDIGAGYLYNLVGADDVAHAITNFTGVDAYHKRVGGVAVYGDINSGPFTLGARWTTAVSRFNPNDLPEDGIVDESSDDVIASDAEGAKPWAAGIQAGYDFQGFGCNNNNIYLGYQTSHEAAAIGLPKHRWTGGYNVDWWTNTNFGIQWDHDTDYSKSDGGRNSSTNLVSLRAAVKFA